MPFFGSAWNDDFDDDSPIGISSGMKEYIGDDYYCIADCGEHNTTERVAPDWNTHPAKEALKAEVEKLKVALSDISKIALESHIARESMRRISNNALKK